MTTILQPTVTTRVVLEYPNGRGAERLIAGSLQSGDEFELYGRVWDVIGPLINHRASRRPSLAPPRLLCRPAS